MRKDKTLADVVNSCDYTATAVYDVQAAVQSLETILRRIELLVGDLVDILESREEEDD